MSRLPTPGGDDGTWGDVLNDFLKVSHNSDGTLKGAVKTSGDQTVAGVKTFSSSPIVPTPTGTTDAANKDYVDNVATSGAPDADATTKGLVQLAGDLSGTAASPAIASGAITSAKIADGTIVNADISSSAAIDQSKISGLTTDLSGKQNSDADLTAIAALTPTNDDVIQRKAGAWTNRTPAQLKTDLSLTKSDVGLSNVDNTSDANKPVSTATQTALDLKLDDSQLDIATDLGGVSTSDTKIASQKATKTYVDAQVSGVTTPDADATTKGKVQLTNDFGGTAAAPTVVATHLSSALPVLQGGTGSTTAGGARTNLGLGTVSTLDSDIDGTLAANSDSKIATQKAVKTYVDANAGSVPDADATTKGKVQLAGDLGGTAASPTVTFSNDTIHTLKSTLTTKGDIYVATAASTPARLGVGNKAESLAADSSQASGARWAPADINIGSVIVGGHSYFDTTAGLVDNNSYGNQIYTDQSFLGRTLALLGVDYSRVRNYAVAAAYFLRATSSGSYLTMLRALTPYKARAPYTTPHGLCIGVWGINDAQIYGDDAQYKTAYQHALRAVISRWRAAAVFENDDSSVAYSGSGGSHWSVTTSTTINTGANYATTSTLNDTFTITVPSSFEGGTIALGFIGASGTTGGTVSVTVDAVSAGTISTSNITADGNRTGMVMRLTGLSSGAHTIVGTVSALDGGGSVQFDYWQIESPYPNPVIICNIAKLVTYSNLGSDAVIDAWNTAISSVVAEFDSPIAVADLDSAINKTASRLSYDAIHPSELGAKYGAEAIRQAFVSTGGSLHDFSVSNHFYAMSSIPWPVAPTAGTTWVAQMGLQSTSAGLTLSHQKQFFVPVVFTRPCTISTLSLLNEISGGNANTVYRFGIYWDYNGKPKYVHTDAGTVAHATGTNSVTLSTSARIVVPGLYWLVVCAQGNTAGTADPVVSALVGGHPAISAPTATNILRPSSWTNTTISGAFGTITAPNGANALAPEIYATVSSTP